MKITEISVQKRNKDRCNVYIDGKYALSLDSFTVLSNKLKTGDEITEERLSEIAFESEKDKAVTYAFDYLSRYFKTEKGLRDKLFERGYPAKIVYFVIDKVKEYGYIDDGEYGRMYVENNKNKKGAKLIRYELKQKGLSDEVLGELEFYEEDEENASKKIAEKYFAKKEKSKENFNKLYASLVRKGFSYDTVSGVLKKFKGEDDEDF